MCIAPVYLEDVKLINRSYARAGSAVAATRKLAIMSTQRAAGRSCEVAWTTWDGVSWDKKFRHAFVEVPQPKGSKIKLVAFGAGVERSSDWFVALGDYLVLQPDRALYSEDNAAWVFPELQKTSSPGTTLGNYIKALLPADRGGHDHYQDPRLILHELPLGVTAGGLRPGACNELLAAMPAELATHVSGHDLTKTSAFFEYIDATRAGCMPGSVVLGGWEPLPWGHMGKGPVPPSISVLEEAGVDMNALEMCIDVLFRLDSATPPMLWRQGSLRPMVHAAFASMVMYFDERKDVGEMHRVLEAMCDALKDSRVRLDEGAAPAVFSRWAAALKVQFDLDNLHLKMRSADTAVAQVVTAVQSLGRVVSGMHATLGALQRETAQLRAAAGAQAAPTPARSSAPGSARASASGASASHADEPEPLPHTVLALGSPPPPPPALPPPPNAFAAMLPASQAGPEVSLTGVKAHTFYSDNMALRNGGLPPLASKQQKPKAELCMSFFNGMATAIERAQLKPPVPPATALEEGERRRLVVRLHEAIIARLSAAYEEAGLAVPRDYAKPDYYLPATGPASAVEALKGKVILDPSTFETWRREWEAERERRRESGEAPPPAKKAKKK